MAWFGGGRKKWRGGRAYEVDTDGGDVGLSVGVIGKSQQQARLSYTGITDEEELEEIVVSRREGLEDTGDRKRAAGDRSVGGGRGGDGSWTLKQGSARERMLGQEVIAKEAERRTTRGSWWRERRSSRRGGDLGGKEDEMVRSARAVGIDGDGRWGDEVVVMEMVEEVK